MLQFEQFESAIDATFWEALAKNKMDTYRLDDSDHSIVGWYQGGQQLNSNAKSIALPSRIQVSAPSFNNLENDSIMIRSPGLLKNFNTIQEFKDLDKNGYLRGLGMKLIDSIVSGRALKDPQQLSSFGLITFAELKKYKFYYWFAFPTIVPATPFECKKYSKITDSYSDSEIAAIHTSYANYKKASPTQAGFFIMNKKASNGKFTISALSEWKATSDRVGVESILIGFVDPSGLEDHPGWPLRNLLLLIQHEFKVSKVQILCYKLNDSNSAVSTLLDIEIETPKSQQYTIDNVPVTGWEKGSSGKLTPRLADLAPLMDPKQLASTAVDLNLKLMRWRILPDLNLDNIAQMKCLLLGAGTLGCYVSRMLMAWGIRHITFVDNGKVSFSNPVRQPLFNFKDCLDGGSPKAAAAAESLRAIFPGMSTEGIDLSIPMPGHPISGKNQMSKDLLSKLEELVKSHDAIFLLTDSRESRWLPTMLGAANQKVVLNAALGFDSYLVMRHGMRNGSLNNNLGCYFCNDVVAPTDSLSDRTLDQQCTVTRPGLSGIASATVVELLSSIANHPKGPWAEAEVSTGDGPDSTPLGIVPHQIRGFLAKFSTTTLTGQMYDKCTACSEVVLNEYKKHGHQFILKVINDPAYLEDLTGLKKMKEESENIDLEWDGQDDF